MAAPFVDTARITVKAGSGGNGAVAFHREKYVAAGGPDGGDGGRGGSVILEINEHMSTLMDFRYKRKYVAGNGSDGAGKRCTGKDGEDLILRVLPKLSVRRLRRRLQVRPAPESPPQRGVAARGQDDAKVVLLFSLRHAVAAFVAMTPRGNFCAAFSAIRKSFQLQQP